MKTLELKHLAPYLPYELMLWDGEESFKMLTEYIIVVQQEGWKPILRPLSDLTKEIEHNGEKFVPIERIFKPDMIKILGGVEEIYKTWVKDGKITTALTLDAWQKFYEWHIDCFSLIENNLAVDINTLNK
ncbi:MAG: hypothetical protein IIC76_14960 [Bacteroidetes bacterium]|nr:hypothetical protein [Bacteroidota bacterium]